MNFYVSSYGKGEQKGIYICRLDKENNKISLVKQIHTKDYPSYMITKDNLLYTSFKDAGSGVGGGVANYVMKKDDLEMYSFFDSMGRSYTHLCISKDNHYLFTANYHVGATAAFLLKDKKIIKKIGTVHHHGLGIDLLKRQTGPHAHYVGITPDDKYLYSVDLGADKVVMYDYTNGILTEQPKCNLLMIPGSGPRHMIFSKDGRFSYVINEISNSIMVYSYLDGHYTLIQGINCVPRHFHDFSSAAAIRMTESGHHMMISNRGHDSVVLYRVNQETGKISLLYMVHTGKGPRDFNIIDDKYVIVASQEDNEIELYTFDEKTEELKTTGEKLNIPQPVCVAY
ncbi:MAG: lactonase family protein [Faecalibacillus sp.]